MCFYLWNAGCYNTIKLEQYSSISKLTKINYLKVRIAWLKTKSSVRTGNQRVVCSREFLAISEPIEQSASLSNLSLKVDRYLTNAQNSSRSKALE